MDPITAGITVGGGLITGAIDLISGLINRHKDNPDAQAKIRKVYDEIKELLGPQGAAELEQQVQLLAARAAAAAILAGHPTTLSP